MKSYRLKLRPLASWSTPWQADTLFAALCWQARMAGGETMIDEILAPLRAGDPPFLLSDAFPEDWMPCPLSVKFQGLPNSNMKTRLPEWVRLAQFQALLRGAALLHSDDFPEPPMRNTRYLHASIDRISGTTEGTGRLFETEETWLRTDDSTGHLVIYIRTEDWLEKLVALFQLLGETGFGRKRSSGKGAFHVMGAPEACEWMDASEGANAFVSLSHFVPATADPANGRWGLLTKYPKFSPMATVSPFKGRLVMLRPGSVFRTTDPVRPHYGRIFTGISSDFPSAVHYALAFPVPFYWPEQEVQ